MNANVRLLPLVAAAALCLAGLKGAGLVFGGGYMLSGSAPAVAQAPAQAPEPAAAGAQAQAEPESAAAASPAVDTATLPSAGSDAPGKVELDVLESLAERRRALERRAREIDLRENLLRAAEEQVERRIEALKAIDARIQKELEGRDEQRQEQVQRLVRIYTEMKPKDAARILNRANVELLIELTSKINPRDMAPILAQMDPLVAQRLTQEIARRNAPIATEDTDSALPKIEGRGPS